MPIVNEDAIQVQFDACHGTPVVQLSVAQARPGHAPSPVGIYELPGVQSSQVERALLISYSTGKRIPLDWQVATFPQNHFPHPEFTPVVPTHVVNPLTRSVPSTLSVWVDALTTS